MTDFKSQFKSASDSPGFMLWKVSNLHQRLERRALSGIDLTPTQFSVLASYFFLCKQLGAVQQADICNHAGIDKMQVSDVTRALEKAKLVQKRSNPNDKRSSLIIVTVSGQKKCNAALKIIENLDKKFFSACENFDSFLVELNKLALRNED